jgi:mRNA interferase MazF
VAGAYAPGRGDLVWLAFTPQAGHEQSGTRPALVLSPVEYNRKVGLALVCPVTSQVKGYPFEVALPPGQAVSGAVLSDRVKSLDWRARKARLAGRVTGQLLAEVTARIRVLVDPEG